MPAIKTASASIIGALGWTISYAAVKEALSFGVLILTFLSALTLYIWAWIDRKKKTRRK